VSDEARRKTRSSKTILGKEKGEGKTVSRGRGHKRKVVSDMTVSTAFGHEAFQRRSSYGMLGDGGGDDSLSPGLSLGR
jgi:hypothetical protein